MNGFLRALWRASNLTLLVCAGAAMPAHASLVARGNGMVYDTVLDVTWLTDFNYAKTSGYTGTGVDGATGQMTWDVANAWAGDLVYGGFSDWRLASTNTTSSSGCDASFDAGSGFGNQYVGASCSGSELGHLFYSEFGGLAYENLDQAVNNAVLSLFSNVQLFDAYWTSTAYQPESGSAWFFNNGDGTQGIATTDNRFYAVAVRAGDVPEPSSLALIALAGLGLGWQRSRGHGSKSGR